MHLDVVVFLNVEFDEFYGQFLRVDRQFQLYSKSDLKIFKCKGEIIYKTH